MEAIISASGMSNIYQTLDTVHMDSLRNYVYEHLTFQVGQKPRTKVAMMAAIVQIVQATKADQTNHRRTQSRRSIDKVTRTYAKDALTECDKMKRVLHGKCKGLRGYTKACKDAKKLLKGPDWVQMESNIRRIEACDETSGCTDSVVDAAGDIGNYVATCPGVTCYQASKITGTMPGGPCRRFRK